MPDDFVIARNPDGDSTLPYLLRIPLGERGVILQSCDTWPRTAKCETRNPAQEWTYRFLAAASDAAAYEQARASQPDHRG